MNSLTDTVTPHSRHLDGRSPQEMLDALSSGTCDPEDFFQAVSDRLQRAPDTGWEILALVDQYYRRGKITSETFGSVKARLQDLLLGKGGLETGTPVKPRAVFSREPRPASVPNPARASKPVAAVGAPPLRSFRAAQGPGSPGPAALDRTSALPVAKSARAPAGAFITRPASIPLSGHGSDYESPGERFESAGRTPVEGDLLRGRYLVKGVLGKGGMGTVFEAVDQFRVDGAGGDQRVAVKVLHTAVIQRPQLFAELRREFQHLQSLAHPNIVRVHEFDRDGDLAFFTMEYLRGALLGRVVANRETPLFRPYAWAIIRDVGAAIVHAHSRGVVHGDLNPGNIFITENGEVRVLDFGASHQLHHGPWISEETPQHVPVATPSYASCQLLAGEAADARDDIYALACVAYFLLAGHHPFDDQTALRARSLRLTPRRPFGITRRQWHALKAGLSFEREQRPSNAREWLARLDLSGAVQHLPELPVLYRPQRQRRGGRAWAVAALALIIVGATAAGVWVATNVDSVTRAGDRLVALGASVFATGNPRAGDPQAGSPPVEAPQATAAAPSEAARLAGSAPSLSGGAVSAALSGSAMAATSPDDSGASSPSNSGRAANAVTAAGGPNASRATAAARPASGTALAAAGPTAATAASPPLGTNGVPFRARIELSADAVEVSPGDPVARITVRRSRAMRGDADFSWWTESGTAKPGRDFVPVKAHVETMASGKTSASLDIPLIVDPAQRDSRSFYVVIDAANEDAAVGPRTLTMITIPGPAGP